MTSRIDLMPPSKSAFASKSQWWTILATVLNIANLATPMIPPKYGVALQGIVQFALRFITAGPVTVQATVAPIAQVLGV